MDKTTSVCAKLDELKVKYYRHPFLNIITIRAKYISPELARQFMLVPDNHDDPKWFKIVMMDHVKRSVLDEFISRLSNELLSKKA